MTDTTAAGSLSIPKMQWKRLLQLNRPLPRLRNACIHTEIEQQSITRPGKVAITSSAGNLTYQQLDQAARQLASLLTSHGVGPEIIVPLCFEKSRWMIVSMLAVLKAGGAFVAIDPNQPMARTKAILDQIDATLVVTSHAQQNLFSGLALDVLHVSDSSSRTWPDAADWTPPLVMPENAAYNIFTSGSTGVPKGILVEHHSFCSGAALHAPAQFLDEKSRVLQFAAYTHDTCLAEILTTLIEGGTVCVPSEEQRRNALTEFINENRINWAVLTPSFLTSINPADVPTLEVVVLAGERLSQSNIRQWARALRLLSGYGVSECSVVTTISKPLSPDTSASHIGLPAGGVCWIVDPLDVDRILPIGEVGEIIIEGPTVARGYIKDPAGTRRAFIDAPKWLIPILDTEQRQNRLYRTGDLGRQNPDGTLDFVSRLDSQVKISGRRIELGEIEHHVSAHSEVRLCVVLYPNSGAYRNELVAILQLHSSGTNRQEGNGPTVEIQQQTSHVEVSKVAAIAQNIRSKAPRYMVPSVWLVIDQFPILPSAKLDRPSVKKWLESRMVRTNLDNFASPIPLQDSIALKVAAELAQVLGRRTEITESDGLVRDTAFINDGMDSIKAISLMRSLQRLFGVKVKVEYLLDDKATPTTIAGYIRLARSSNLSEYRAPEEKDIGKKFHLLRKRFDESMVAAVSRSPPHSVQPSTVFLTGATGYLGHDILRCLLRRNCKVIALVRASSIREGRKKLIDRSIAGAWWTDDYDSLLEIWLGDLSKPNLGLSSQQRDILRGQGRVGDAIDAIIHNGATVHWTEGARALWPVNVEATVTLLEAALESRVIKNFVYVSGGANLEGSIESQLADARDGYTQTKLVSQALIQYMAARSRDTLGLTMSVVKPGFIVGNHNGIANPRDYLWRFVASVISLGAYDQSTTDNWIAVSTAADVASTTVNQLFSSAAETSPTCDVSIKDGLYEKDLWKILMQSLGYNLSPVDHATWVSKLQHDLENRREAHLLWPLHSVLEYQRFGIGRADTTTLYTCREKLHSAIISNIEYLSSINFISS